MKFVAWCILFPLVTCRLLPGYCGSDIGLGRKQCCCEDSHEFIVGIDCWHVAFVGFPCASDETKCICAPVASNAKLEPVNESVFP